MSMTTSSRGGGGHLERPTPSSLADTIDVILDKGLVIDAYVRVSLVGIELITIDARIVVASVDTYLRFAEATNRLDLHQKGGQSLTEAIGDLQQGGAKEKTSGALEGVKESAKKAVGMDDEEEEDEGDDDSEGGSRSAKKSSAPRRRRQE